MTNPNIKTISVHELKNRMAQNSELCLIDVREQEEWQSIRMPKAIHIPKDIIASNIHALSPDKDNPLFLYCKGGVRSLYAAQYLIDMGYTEVYSIDGGIMEWARHGYTVER